MKGINQPSNLKINKSFLYLFHHLQIFIALTKQLVLLRRSLKLHLYSTTMFKFDFNIEEDKNEVSEYATNTTQNETEDIKSSESPTSVEPPAFIVFSIEKLASQVHFLHPITS